jgi:hypothetical protein
MSAKSIADKLLVKPNTTLWLSHPDRLQLIEPLPAGARVVDRLEEATVGLAFVDSATAARKLCDAQRDQLARPGVLWFAYPKGNKADINRDSLWPIVAEYGLRPNAQVALDDVWSALRFRPNKEGEGPFTGGRSETN